MSAGTLIAALAVMITEHQQKKVFIQLLYAAKYLMLVADRSNTIIAGRAKIHNCVTCPPPKRQGEIIKYYCGGGAYRIW
jgi:hypothetical protein